MKRPALRGLAAVILFVAASAQAQATYVRGEVIRVLDGDTVDILVNQQPVRIRLANIDAPEIRHGRKNPGQPFGQRSRQTLAQLIFRQNVIVDDKGKDQYGRMIGTIYRGNLDVNADMVRVGMAWVYRHYSHDPKLLRFESEARAARRGLWADPHPVPPWVYRHSR